MKKFVVTKAEGGVDVWKDNKKIGPPDSIELYGQDDMQVSDGYHTMDELYDHRIELYIALCHHKHDLLALENPGKHKVWRSKLHADGTFLEGWFVLGIGTEKGKQITYHLPLARWGDTEFAETLDRGPEWDGHTSNDVLTRLKNL